MIQDLINFIKNYWNDILVVILALIQIKQYINDKASIKIFVDIYSEDNSYKGYKNKYLVIQVVNTGRRNIYIDGMNFRKNIFSKKKVLLTQITKYSNDIPKNLKEGEKADILIHDESAIKLLKKYPMNLITAIDTQKREYRTYISDKKWRKILNNLELKEKC